MKMFATQTMKPGVSLLALVETVSAAGVAAYLAFNRETIAVFAISVAIAPLLLLRTRNSTAHGIRLARRFVAWESQISTLQWPLGILGTFAYPTLIRVWVTLVALARDFTGCVQAVPTNWIGIVAHLDSTVLPQVVPGFRSRYTSLGVASDWWDLRVMNEARRKIFHRTILFPIWSVFLLMTLLIITPVLLYRWTLKSTFWIYLPLLWILQPVNYSARKLWHRIDWITVDRVAVVFSSVILTLGLIKIRIWQLESEFAEWLHASRGGRFLADYIVPDSMPVWQYASMFNAILVIGMFFAARSAVQARKQGDAWPEAPLDVGLRIGIALRRLITSYTTLVLVLITLKRGFPPLGEFLPL